MGPVLVEPERRVGHVGPSHSIALVGVLRSGHQFGDVAEDDFLAVAGVGTREHQLVDHLLHRDILGNVLGAGPVVGEKDDERVVESPGVFERLEDAADPLVHAVHLRRVHLHATQQPFLVPGILPGRLGRVAAGELPGGVDDPHVDQARKSRLAKLVPSRVEASLVPGDVLLVRVQRPVRRGVGDVLKERRVGVAGLVRTNLACGLVADGVGVEEILVAFRLVVDVLVSAGQGVRMVEAARADDRSVELVEAALHRPRVRRFFEAARHVPLAAHVAAVSARLECLRDRHATPVQIARVPFGAGRVGEDSDAGLMRMQSGQQGRPRRAAPGRVVEL